ncbi:hypothetical protein CA13_06970 [Planctomycetes bacterium CA13]|uniref:Uncharacterized protein n=1 Tax=Novipirellula herctigrandis TaxID=2527986 RepID=A0A5C5YWA0_9BACT|nr:hypothetical protein CA13_06970 [Planctomycetes bacterium CA13]
MDSTEPSLAIHQRRIRLHSPIQIGDKLTRPIPLRLNFESLTLDHPFAVYV